MKEIIGFAFVMLVCLVSYGQAQEGSVEYQHKLHPAAVIELPYSPSMVNAAMNDYLSKKGKSKGDDIKGFTTYRNMQAIQNDSSNADLYFKTERKSHKEKEVTVVSLLLSPTDVQTNNSHLHYMNMEEGKSYLNNLAIAVDAYNLELTIKDQNHAVIIAETKYKILAGEGSDLENKRTAIEKKIADNKADQQQQLREIENQKQKLTVSVNQRKS